MNNAEGDLGRPLVMEASAGLEDSGSSNKGRKEAKPWGCQMAAGAARKIHGSTEVKGDLVWAIQGPAIRR